MTGDLDFKIRQAADRYKAAVDKVHELRNELLRAEKALMRADTEWSNLVAAQTGEPEVYQYKDGSTVPIEPRHR